MILNGQTSSPFLPSQEAERQLVDSFGRMHNYLRISLTDRCNLRCSYCMPPQGVALSPREDILTFAEITRITAILSTMGVTKIRLTGGEPLVRRNVSKLIADLRKIPAIDTIAMTTNGVKLKEEIKELKAAGIDTVNISLDTLRPDRFAKIARRYRFQQVMEGIDAALSAGFKSVKLNTVVIKDFNVDEIVDFVELARHNTIEVRFIEFMPFNGNNWSASNLFPYNKIIAHLLEKVELIAAPDQDPSAPARSFIIPGFKGRVGIIASMTKSFCNSCTRIRLMADGGLKTCLFHHPELNLRDLMRTGASDTTLEQAIRRAVSNKPEGHAAMEVLADHPNRSMVRIGG